MGDDAAAAGIGDAGKRERTCVLSAAGGDAGSDSPFAAGRAGDRKAATNATVGTRWGCYQALLVAIYVLGRYDSPQFIYFQF